MEDVWTMQLPHQPWNISSGLTEMTEKEASICTALLRGFSLYTAEPNCSLYFLDGTVVKNWPSNAGGTRGLIPGWGRSHGVGNGNQLQYSCLENSMDRRVCQAILQGVAKTWTRLGRQHNWAHSTI